MRIVRFAGAIRRWWWLLVGTMVAGAIVGASVSLLSDPQPRATTTLLVAPVASSDASPTDDGRVECLTSTLARLVLADGVLEETLAQRGDDLDVSGLGDRISVDRLAGSQLIEVTVRAASTAEATDLADTLAEVFIASDEVNLTAGVGVVSIVELARPVEASAAPRRAIGAVIGTSVLALLGLMAIAVRARLDQTVRRAEDIVELTGGGQTVGRLGDFGARRALSDQLPVAHDPQSAVAEDFRVSRTNLILSMAGGEDAGRLIVVTSPSAGEGKSTVSANLAVAFGLAGHRVALVDADLRGPTQHRLFDLNNQQGLTTLLVAPQFEFNGAVQRCSQESLSVITSGPLPLNPSELLGSQRMQDVLQELRQAFDIVIIDSPPVLDVTDPAVIASSADSVVLIARVGHTRMEHLREATASLRATAAPIQVILNGVHMNGRRAEYYGAKASRRATAGQRDGSREPLA